MRGLRLRRLGPGRRRIRGGTLAQGGSGEHRRCTGAHEEHRCLPQQRSNVIQHEPLLPDAYHRGLIHSTGCVKCARPDPGRPVPDREEADVDGPEHDPEAEQEPKAPFSRLILRLRGRLTKNPGTIGTELARLPLDD
jgi:hypothetical protein